MNFILKHPRKTLYFGKLNRMMFKRTCSRGPKLSPSSASLTITIPEESPPSDDPSHSREDFQASSLLGKPWGVIASSYWTGSLDASLRVANILGSIFFEIAARIRKKKSLEQVGTKLSDVTYQFLWFMSLVIQVSSLICTCSSYPHRYDKESAVSVGINFTSYPYQQQCTWILDPIPDLCWTKNRSLLPRGSPGSR